MRLTLLNDYLGMSGDKVHLKDGSPQVKRRKILRASPLANEKEEIRTVDDLSNLTLFQQDAGPQAKQS